MTPRMMMVLAAALSAAGVALGAFGAHALKARATEEMLTVWQTAVQYHLLHALALFGIGLLARQPAEISVSIPAALMLAGVLLFSGSLYVLVLSGTRAFGMITPFGGVAFIAGWLWLAFAVWRA